MLRVAVLGQGSIGRRHADLLVERGCEVLVWDPAGVEAPVAGTRVAASQDEALRSADAAVVASPTIAHLKQALAAVRAGCSVLVEKPLAVASEGVAELIAEAAEREVLLAVAMNLRFHPGPVAVQAAVAAGEIGKPLMGQVSFGSYLPDWRPQVDYRQTYSARAELGGGVLLDVVHELDYLTWALGAVVEVSAWLERVSDLEMDVEDVALLHLRHRSGAVSSLQLDYLDRGYRRGCRIVGAEGTVVWDWAGETVTVTRAGGEVETRPAPGDFAVTYRDEIAAFVSAAQLGTLEGSGLVGAEAGASALRVIDAARRSAAERMTVGLGGA